MDSHHETSTAELVPLHESEEHPSTRPLSSCQRRFALGCALSAAVVVSATMAWVGKFSSQPSRFIAEEDSIGLSDQLQDHHGRCLYPDSFEAGANLSLGECKNVSSQFFVVKDSMIMLGKADGTVLCVTLGEYDDKVDGKRLYFDKCIDGYYRQRIAGFCLYGEGSKNHVGAQAWGQYCEEQKKHSRPLMGTSLFCWMAVLPNSGEVALKDAAASRGAGIFACEANRVFQSWPTGTFNTPDGAFTANTDVFIKVWQQVFDDKIYKAHDWTVKVDADTVFSPGRLRGRLWNLGTKIDEPVYVKNTWKSFGFLGPIEILSQTAVARLSELDLPNQCQSDSNGGEDGWIKWCMDDEAKIGWKEDVNLLYSGCQLNRCGDHSFVAYHHYKDPGSWNACMDAAW